MTILNQDRDVQIEATERELYESLRYEDKYYDDKYLGTNLMFDDILLGTFDIEQEAGEELIRIITCPYDYYIVSGFSAWYDWRTLIKIMLNNPLNITL